MADRQRTRRTRLRVRALGELVLAAAAFTLAVVTLVTKDWIELVFRVDPDAHSGAVEWALVGVLMVAAAVLTGLGLRDRGRIRGMAVRPTQQAGSQV
jgi:hypothetical protein